MSLVVKMCLVLAVLALGAAALRRYQVRHRPSPEHVRKLFHVLAGAVALGLPCLFATVWPVALLCVVVALALLVVRCSRTLRDGIGSTIHGIRRRSFGDLCFPLGVGAAFVLAGGDRVQFAVPVLTLTFADPAAAIVGLRYGRHSFRVAGDGKTLEGSAAFFVVAAVCAAVTSVVFGSGLVSPGALVVFALTLTVVEAAAPRGVDNLLIPVVGALAFDAWLRAAAV
jgi:phytol kinase